jgi:hypothetical protein
MGIFHWLRARPSPKPIRGITFEQFIQVQKRAMRDEMTIDQAAAKIGLDRATWNEVCAAWNDRLNSDPNLLKQWHREFRRLP